MDVATIAGLLLALAAILGGQVLEGGHVGSLVQGAAFLIVMGGTAGAVAVGAPLSELKGAAKLFTLALFPPKIDFASLTKLLVQLASLARKEGVLALESKLEAMDDPFLKRAIQTIVDGVDRAVARDLLEADVQHHIKTQLASAKIYEAAGGYAPTIGILGAVLGLIHVMENLADPSKLGAGIAVAFVATIYGVGVANLFFLPISNKLKTYIAAEKTRRTVIIEASLSIQEGLPTTLLQEKLSAYSGYHPEQEKD